MAIHCNTSPLDKSPERAFALQKYLLLHSQHDALQRHLNSITSTYELPAEPKASHHSHSSISSSTIISPIPEMSDHFSLSRYSRPSLGRPRRSSLPVTMATVQPSVVVGEVEAEEQKLLNVNQQIKTTLTELLNCEGTRSDERYRTWVMQRLMDVERELKTVRRGSIASRISDERRGSAWSATSGDSDGS